VHAAGRTLGLLRIYGGMLGPHDNAQYPYFVRLQWAEGDGLIEVSMTIEFDAWRYRW
jgi:hypothetical protein